VRTPRSTVLVVDDDASIRLLCRVNLELEGWAVREASSIAHAREALADGTVGVVLLDAHLGEEDGVAFLADIRRDHPQTKVAMLTGATDAQALEDAVPDGVIGKPFGLDELTGTVHALAG
jgi:two-component system C4-dicarboxylate transport response regulator DctD